MTDDGKTPFEQFLSWESKTRDTVDFKKIYVDMAGGDVLAGLALSELVYWYLPSKSGNIKLRVKKEGTLWLVVSRKDWWDRVRLSPRQADRALDVLVRLGIAEKTIHKFNSVPTCHIRLIEDVFLNLFKHNIEHPAENPFSPKREIGNNGTVISPKSDIAISPNGDISSHESVRSLTETTTETTTKTTVDAGAALPASTTISTDATQPTGKTPGKKAAGASTRPRARDEMFDAICEVCQVDAKTAGASAGKVKSNLVRAGYTADEVRKFGEWWWSDEFRKRRNIPPTLWQLKERIGIVRGKNVNANENVDAAGNRGGGVSSQETTGAAAPDANTIAAINAKLAEIRQRETPV